MLQAEAMVGDFPEELVDCAREGERQEGTKRLAQGHHCDCKCPKDITSEYRHHFQVLECTCAASIKVWSHWFIYLPIFY